MKIAVTGANGMLGSDIRRVFTGSELAALTRADLDVTDLASAVKKIKDVRPDLLIHAAAYTDVDGSELDPEKAYHVNGIGTRNITMACEEISCPVMYISSDYVFDGTRNRPYDEWDMPNPVNRYGFSKYIGERFVTSLTNRYYIVRTSWLYGRNGKNFVDTIIKLLAERDSIDVVNDQTGSPTYTYDLATKLRELAGKGYGVYHITNSGQCTWYDLAVEIARIKGINKPVHPTSSDKFRRPAKRPSYSVLGDTMLRLEGIAPARPWKEALADYLGG